MTPVEKKPTKPATPRVRKPKAAVVAPTKMAAETAISATPMAETSAVQAAPVKPVVHHGKKYFFAIGRRKSAVAKVRLMSGKGVFKVNDLDFNKYFPTIELQEAALAPLKVTNQLTSLDAIISVNGGGKHGQADSVRHGLTRALVMMDVEFKATVKKLGFLTRDARVKERKKYGLKGARRAPQWAKR